MKILSFGEILFDIYGKSECLGGAPLNFAAHAALQGAKAYLISAVGNDELGKKAIEQINRFGIRDDYIVVSEKKETGKCIVTLDKQFIPSYSLQRDVAYDYIKKPEFDQSERFDVLSFGTLALRQDENMETLQRIIDSSICREIYTDLNIRVPFYSEKSILFCLKNATIVKMSDEELPIITGVVFEENISPEPAMKKLSEEFKNINFIIITCGDKGSKVYDCRNGNFYSCDAEKVDVVSTVGAGDSFGATFVVQFFRNNDVLKSMELASKVAGFVVSKEDAIPLEMANFLNTVLVE